MVSKRYEEYLSTAERLYVVEGKSIQEISEILPPGNTTIRRWRADGDWERRRRDYVAGPKTAVEMAERAVSRLSEEYSAADEATIGLEEIRELRMLVEELNKMKRFYDLFEIAVLAGGEYVTFVNERVESKADRELMFEVWNEFVEEMRKR